MIYQKNKSKLRVSTILLAVIVLFVASLCTFGFNVLQNSDAAAVSWQINYIFHLGSAPYWYGNEIETMSTSRITMIDGPYAFSPNDANNKSKIGKGYLFKGWSATEGSNRVDAQDGFKLNHPTSAKVLTLHYYAVWEKIEKFDSDDSVEISTKSIKITYSDKSEDYGGNREVVVTLSGKVENDSTTDNRLKFYKNTLGWSIDQTAGSSGSTWYLAPKVVDGTLYNNGLPVLRSFTSWTTLRFAIRYTHIDSQVYTVNVASVDVPSLNSDLTNGITNYLAGKSNSNSVVVYGKKFSVAKAIDAGGLNAKINNYIKKNFTYTYEYGTIYVNFVGINDTKNDQIFTKYDLMFKAPINISTNVNKGAFWYYGASTASLAASKSANGTASDLKYKVYADTNITYNNSTANNRFEFNTVTRENGQTVSKKIYVVYRIQDGYSCENIVSNTQNYLYRYPTTNLSSKTWTISANETITSEYSLMYYSLTVGYTVQGSSVNVASQDESGTVKIVKSTSYQPNGGKTSYQDVSYTYDNSQSIFSVEGYELPTTAADLQSIFGGDYDRLLGTNGGGTKRTFNGWLLDVTSLEALGYQLDNNLSGNGTVYYRKSSQWVKFDVGNKITTLNGSRSIYLSLTKVYGYGDFLFGQNSNINNGYCWGTNNNKGFEPASFIMPIVPNWSSEYNLSVSNPKSSVVVDNANTTKTISGVLLGSLNGVYDGCTFKVTSNTNIDFVYSKGTAFYQSDNIKSSSLYNTAGQYGLFNYGHDIIGYQITFKYGGKTFYPYYCKVAGEYSKQWRPLYYNSSDGNYYSDTYNADGSISSKVYPVSQINNQIYMSLNDFKKVFWNTETDVSTNMRELIYCFASWTQGDFVLQGTTFVVSPVWRKADICITEATANQFGSASKIDTVTTSIGNQYNIPFGDSASAGKSIAYYKTKSNKIVVANQNGYSGNVTWNYYNHSIFDYDYNLTNNQYIIELKKFEVDNVYRVYFKDVSNLNLIEDCEYIAVNDSDDGNESIFGGNRNDAYSVTYRTYWNFAASSDCYGSLPNYAITTTQVPATDYFASLFKVQVDRYESNIDETQVSVETLRKFHLRTVYNGANGRYIWVANNHTIGDLAFAKDYYENIAFRFNGVNGAYALTTSKYRGTFVPHSDYLINDPAGLQFKTQNVKSIRNTSWTIDMDVNHIGEEPTLVPIYFRESYKLNLNYYYKAGTYEYNGFVGYLNVVVTDNAAETSSTGGNGKYLVYYNSNKSKCVIYKYDTTSDTKRYKLSLWFDELTEDKIVDCIVIYRGCDVTIEAIDQSKVLDLNKENSFYDPMIGYRYTGELSGRVAGVEKTSLDSYGYTIPFNTNTEVGQVTTINGLFSDAEPVYVNAGDYISLSIYFAPINYDTTIAMTDTNAGQVQISRLGNSNVITTSQPYKLTNLQRGSVAEFFYYAYAGYGLMEEDFTISNNWIKSLDMSGNEIARQTDREKQTYKLNLSGAWLRIYLYKDGTYSVDASQTLGQIDVNIKMLEFDIYTSIIDKYTTKLETQWAEKGWKLDNQFIWELPVTELKTYDGNTIYAYYHNDKYYALLSSWANQPRTPTTRTLLADNYTFLLEDKPVNTYNITTDILFNMVLTERGIIVPEENRYMYFNLEVVEMYKLSLAIVVGVNDTNCSTRTLTISNTDNNTVTLTAGSEYIASQTMPYIYTYRWLENDLTATFVDKYYTGVTFTATEGDVVQPITSPMQATSDMVIYANFTPVQLLVDLTFNYNGTKVIQNPTTSAVDKAKIAEYFTSWQMTTKSGVQNNITNSTETGKVVANDTIAMAYTLKPIYNVTIKVNNSASRLIYDTTTGSYKAVVSTDDYISGKVEIVVDIVDKKQGQLNLKVDKDNSNGAVFHTQEAETMETFADLWINGINYGKTGSFMSGYTVKIKLNSIPTGYKYVGVKKDHGNVDTRYKLTGNEIEITDGKVPEGMLEDDYVTLIAGTYYAVFEKELISTEMILTARNKNNYGYQTNGLQAVWRNGHLAVLKESSVQDTLNFYRNAELADEELVTYYYMDKTGRHDITGTSLTITSEMLENIQPLANGSKLLKIYVESNLKFNLTFTVEEESLQYLEKIEVDGKTLSSVNNIFSTAYSLENTSVTYSISSKLPDKYKITITGDATGTGSEISQSITLVTNRKITVKITKNSYGLTVDEKLYADIVELNNNAPETLTGDDVLNPSINGDKVGYVYNSNPTYVDIVTVAGEGNDKKQLTSIRFEDEKLSFELTLDISSEAYISSITAKKADGGEISKADIKISPDKENVNMYSVSITVDGETYTYTFKKLDTGAIQFGFIGLSNARLTLTYTIYKLISIS